MDPMSLEAKTTLRSGPSAVTVTDAGLRVRTWFKTSLVSWPDVLGFESQLDPADGATGHVSDSGHIVAMTTSGPVDLSGTRRSHAELRYLHALLEAYRLRARRLAGGYA